MKIFLVTISGLALSGCVMTPCANIANNDRSHQVGITFTPGQPKLRIQYESACDVVIDGTLLEPDLAPNDNLMSTDPDEVP